MTPRELLADLNSRGVILTRNGDKLGVKAAPGVITDGTRAELVRYKLALLTLLDPSKPVTLTLTLNEIADGALDRVGFEVERFDNALYRQPWEPTIYLKPK